MGYLIKTFSETVYMSDFDSLERLSPTPLTKEEMDCLEIKEVLWSFEKELTVLNTKLCELVSSVGNILTKLNQIDNSIILKE